MKKTLLIFSIIVAICTNLAAQISFDNEIKKETFTYAIKENDTLKLDKYDVPAITGEKPCIIFVFGGGFSGGQRDSDFNAEYVKNLALNGYVAIAIDYRLGLKNIDQQSSANPMKLVNTFSNAITIAVDDLFDATNYILNNAREWNINKDMIIANGSSAGAITVLQGEYSICNKHELTKRLPSDFNYAGIIAFAGAIFSDKGNIKWPSKPSPILMFHGDADSNVPYNKLEMFNFGIYGSKHISDQLNEMKSPYCFYDIENAAHEIAGKPMTDNLEEINAFINNLVVKKQPLIINTKVQEIGKPELRKDFGIMDFVKSNFDYLDQYPTKK